MNEQKDLRIINLLEKAYKVYQERVKTGSCEYVWYCEEFLAPYEVCLNDSTASTLTTLKSILTLRPLLVQHFFERDDLEHDDFTSLLNAHHTTQKGKHPVELSANVKASKNTATAKKGKQKVTSEHLEVFLTPLQLTMVTEWFNEQRLFATSSFDTDDLRALLGGRSSFQIAQGQNGRVALAFDTLAQQGLIGINWRGFFSIHFSLKSSETNQPLTCSNMYRNLNAIKGKHHNVVEAYLRKTAEIASIKQV